MELAPLAGPGQEKDGACTSLRICAASSPQVMGSRGMCRTPVGAGMRMRRVMEKGPAEEQTPRRIDVFGACLGKNTLAPARH